MPAEPLRCGQTSHATLLPYVQYLLRINPSQGVFRWFRNDKGCAPARTRTWSSDGSIVAGYPLPHWRTAKPALGGMPTPTGPTRALAKIQSEACVLPYSSRCIGCVPFFRALASLPGQALDREVRTRSVAAWPDRTAPSTPP